MLPLWFVFRKTKCQMYRLESHIQVTNFEFDSLYSTEAVMIGMIIRRRKDVRSSITGLGHLPV
jgi:hypothetical protein